MKQKKRRIRLDFFRRRRGIQENKKKSPCLSKVPLQGPRVVHREKERTVDLSSNEL